MYSDTAGSDQGNRLVEQHAPLVKRIAHHLLARMPASVQVDDLIQAGLIGLLEASRNYDPSRGASFETFAGIRIRGAMIDEVRKGDWSPRSVHRNARRVTDAIKKVEDRENRDASDVEVAAEMGVPLDEYHAILKDTSSSKLFSLDEIMEEDSSRHPGQSSSSEDPLSMVAGQRFKEALAEQIAGLPEREKLALALYYDEELNLKEIGLILEVSESRVSQILSQASKRLRARLDDW
jgi:RNA polymerase sigma factor for flagellar operon FliA